MPYITPLVLRAVCTGLALCIASIASAETVDLASTDALVARTTAQLEAKIRTRTNALVDEALDTQIAALQEQSSQRLALAIANRVDTQLAALTNRSMTQMIASGQRNSSDSRARVAEVRMQSGSITLPEGAEMGSHRFDKPFRQTPKIALGVRMNDEPRSRRAPVALRVVRVDEAGFDYEIRARSSDSGHDVTADWVAYAGKSRRASLR